MQAICVPYRARPVYLKAFLELVPTYTNNLPIYLGIQDDDLPFNISLARNVAALASIEDGATDLIFQDIDIIPKSGVDYTPSLNPFIWFMTAGGVKIKTSHFTQINGWNPTFKGWGHEDTEFSIRLAQFDIPYTFWPTSPGVADAEVYNLEIPVDADPEQFTRDYFGAHIPHPQFCHLPNHIVRHVKDKGWFTPELVAANQKLYNLIAENGDIIYFNENGLNLIDYSKTQRQLGRTPGVTSILYHSDRVLKVPILQNP